MKLNVFITDGDYVGPLTTIDMEDKVAKLTLQSSIERVINTSYKLVSLYAQKDEDGYINLEDWDEWKQPIVHMFNAVRNCTFQFYNRGK